jgi:hypothetical protein
VWNRGIKRGREKETRDRENIPPENWPAYPFQGWSNQALLVEYFIIDFFFTRTLGSFLDHRKIELKTTLRE